MKKLILVAAMVLFLAGNALAVPLIDGINGAGEWTTGLIINGFDVNEAGGPGDIPDAYDIMRVAMIQEATGGGSDGLYVLIELYGLPTFTSAGAFPVVYLTSLDVNLNGDISAPGDPLPNDAVDRYFDYRAAGFTVYDGTGTPIAGAPTFAMGSAVEFYIPSGMFAGFPVGAFNTMTYLDNGGFPADDFVPDSGYNTTVPEPASAMLFGFGLMGFIGAVIRRKKFTA